MIIFLKKLRQKHKVSQEFIAREIGVSRPTYAQIEKGTRKILLEEAQDLAAFFGMSLEAFLLGDSELASGARSNKNTKQKRIGKQKTAMRISTPQKNISKLKEVLLYVLENIGARLNVGEAVVCRIMYFIDFDFYEKYEKQLMGAKYIKGHQGPMLVGFSEIVAQMEKDGDLIQVNNKHFQHDQRKCLPLRRANLDNISAHEKELMDMEIERFKDFDTVHMKEYSKRDVPWIGSDDMQPIDYEATFSRTPEFSMRQYEDEV